MNYFKETKTWTLIVFRHLLIFFVCFLTAKSTFGQDIGLSGYWILQDAKHISGPEYLNGLPGRILITQTPEAIKIQRVYIGVTNTESIEEETLLLSQKSTTQITQARRMRTAAVTELNKNSLTENVILSQPWKYDEKEYSVKYSFNIDGDRLTYTRSNIFEINPKFKNWKMQGIYKKVILNENNKNGIYFEPGSWSEAINKAKREQKYIFIDCYATWCGVCKQMDNEVFKSPLLADLMNRNFVSFKIQVDSTTVDSDYIKSRYKKSNELASLYEVKSLPTLLFLSPEGKLVHKGIGYRNLSGFNSLVNEVISDNGYYSRLEKYRQGQKRYNERIPFIEQAKVLRDKVNLKELTLDYIENYLSKLNETDFLTKQNIELHLISAADLSMDDRLFKIMLSKPALVDSIAQNPGLSKRWIGAFALKDELRKYRVPNWKLIRADIKAKYPIVDVDRLIMDKQISYYGNQKDWNKQIYFFGLKVEKFGISSLGTFGANEITTVVTSHTNNKKILQKAVVWMEQRIKESENTYGSAQGEWGNYGAILYKSGRRQEGIRFIEKHLAYMLNFRGAKTDLLNRYLIQMKAGDKMGRDWDYSVFF